MEGHPNGRPVNAPAHKDCEFGAMMPDPVYGESRQCRKCGALSLLADGEWAYPNCKGALAHAAARMLRYINRDHHTDCESHDPNEGCPVCNLERAIEATPGRLQ